MISHNQGHGMECNMSAFAIFRSTIADGASPFILKLSAQPPTAKVSRRKELDFASGGFGLLSVSFEKARTPGKTCFHMFLRMWNLKKQICWRTHAASAAKWLACGSKETVHCCLVLVCPLDGKDQVRTLRKRKKLDSWSTCLALRSRGSSSFN